MKYRLDRIDLDLDGRTVGVFTTIGPNGTRYVGTTFVLALSKARLLQIGDYYEINITPVGG